MSISVSFAGQTYSIPSVAGENGWTSLTTYLQALASNAATATTQKQSIRTALTTPVNLTTTDYAVVVKLTSPAAVSVVLPTGVTGQLYTIVDGTGDALTNSITITATGGQLINGAASYVLNENNGALIVQFGATGWRILASFVGENPQFSSIKITGISNSKALVSSASGLITASTVTTTELQQLSGILSAAVGLTDSQTVTNKNLSTGTVISAGKITTAVNEVDAADNTKQMITQLSGATTGTSTTLAMAQTANRVVTFPDATDTLVARSTTDTLLNKTVVSSTAAITGALTLPSGTAAQRPTPAAGMTRLNTDSNEFEGYANGIWSSIGGGLNEQPVKNYLKTYANAAVTPGTLSTVAVGGNITVASGTSAFYADVTSGASALSSSASTLLRGNFNYLSAVSGAALAGTTFFQLPAMTLETTDAGKPISISFDTTGNTLDGDWDVVIANYDSAGTFKSLIPVAGNASSATSTPSAKLPTGTSTFNGFFVSTSTAGDVFALRFRRLANSVQIRIDSLMVGNTPVRVGAPVTDWQSYTPTVQGLGTLASPEIFWRRVGDSIDIQARFTTGTVSASTVQFGLPSGLTVATLTSTNEVGKFIRNVTTANGIKQGVVLAASGNTFLTMSVDDYTNAIGPFAGQNGNAIFGSVEAVSFFARGIPIANWSSNVQMADRAVESYYSSTTGTWDAAAAAGNTVYGAAGSVISGALTATRTKVVRLQQPLQATDTLVLEYQLASATGPWVPQHETSISYQTQQAIEFGGKIASVSGTDVSIQFNQFSTAGSTYNTGTGAGNYSSAQTYAWRLRVVSSGAQIGGAISTANIVGRTDGSTVGSGYLGEQQRAVRASSSASAVATATAINVQSITLTPGVWDISGVVGIAGNLTGTQAIAYLSNVSATLPTAASSLGDNRINTPTMPTTASDLVLAIPQYRVTVTTSEIWYLGAYVAYTAGSATVYGRISAVRIA